MNNSTESTSNNQTLIDQNKKEETREELPKRPEPRAPLINPLFMFNKSLNQPKAFGSHIFDKNNNMGERINSFCSFPSHQEYNNMNQPLFPSFKNFPPLIPSWKMPNYGLFNSHLREEQKIPTRLEPNDFLLNCYANENEDFYKEKKENKTMSELFHYNNKFMENKFPINKAQTSNLNLNVTNIDSIFNKKINPNGLNSPKKNENLNNNQNNTNNSGTKFFTNHNYGYKCSCSKTQCNRKYCECFNSGNYCVDCNCKNCNNKPPVNSYTNKHPTDDQNKSKKEKVICTCTKSGCNKNYCECFKIGQKCSALCRCIGCENNDQIQMKKYNNNYQCNLANSIYIVKNKLFIEDIKKKEMSLVKGDFIGNNKKIKREENKNEENNNKINKKKIINNNYECCPANSIYIIKNNIIIESINKEKYFEKKFKNNLNILKKIIIRFSNYIEIN